MKLFIGFIGRTRGGSIIKITDYDLDKMYYVAFFHENRILYSRDGSCIGFDMLDIISEIEPERTQKVDVLIEALEFYADPNNYKRNVLENDGRKNFMTSPVHVSYGYKAKKALAQYKGSEND